MWKKFIKEEVQVLAQRATKINDYYMHAIA